MTKNDIVKRARRLLADELEPYRWSDDTMHDAIVDAVAALNSITPSTRYVDGKLLDRITVPDEDDEEFPIDAHFTEALSLYVAAVCYTHDDPDNQNAALSESYLAKARSLFQM